MSLSALEASISMWIGNFDQSLIANGFESRSPRPPSISPCAIQPFFSGATSGSNSKYRTEGPSPRTFCSVECQRSTGVIVEIVSYLNGFTSPACTVPASNNALAYSVVLNIFTIVDISYWARLMTLNYALRSTPPASGSATVPGKAVRNQGIRRRIGADGSTPAPHGATKNDVQTKT